MRRRKQEAGGKMNVHQIQRAFSANDGEVELDSMNCEPIRDGCPKRITKPGRSLESNCPLTSSRHFWFTVSNTLNNR